ncbi:MAG: hypothetical protein L0177_03140, partial [Chloroflexi bacterium]|nr:hypothetical protein [Chloroflexota bacterium]
MMRAISLLVVELTLIAAFAAMTAYSLSQTFAANDASFRQVAIPYSELIFGSPTSISGLTMLMLIVFVPSGLLFLLYQYMGFWTAAWLGMALHVPAIFAHSRLEWTKFIGLGDIPEAGLTQPETFSLIIGSVVTLFMIHRLIGHSIRQKALETQGVSGYDRFLVLRGEVAMTCGVAALSLVVTAAVIGVGSALGSAEGLFTRLPWMVLTIGLIMLALTS